jgi:hypothetical protein
MGERVRVVLQYCSVCSSVHNVSNFQKWSRIDPTQSTKSGVSIRPLQRIIFPFPSCPVNPHVFCMGVYGSMTPPPQGPQGLPNAPPADPGRAQDIAFRWWDPVMTYATFHAPETSFGPHFNTFLAWVETRGHEI